MKRSGSNRLVIYGWHACQAALHNPNRQVHRVYLANPSDALALGANAVSCPIQSVDRRFLQQLLGPEAVHQGVACEVSPLLSLSLTALKDITEPHQIVVCLDQVTDPHNVGAVLRSCAAFGVRALVLTERHAPPESPALVKSASGAYERVPLIRVANLSQSLKELQQLGFWTVGFAETGQQSLNAINLKGKVALVLGSEGDGLRRLTKENLDFLAYLPTIPEFSTLNVSNAAAIGLYEVFRQQQAAQS